MGQKTIYECDNCNRIIDKSKTVSYCWIDFKGSKVVIGSSLFREYIETLYFCNGECMADYFRKLSDEIKEKCKK